MTAGAGSRMPGHLSREFAKMDFKEALREGVQKSLITKGNDTREQFWRFFIIYLPLACLISIFFYFIVPAIFAVLFGYGSLLISMLLWAIVCLILYIPLITAIIRRLHDVGKPGYFWILWFVPGVNLYIFYLLAKKGVAKNAN